VKYIVGKKNSIKIKSNKRNKQTNKHKKKLKTVKRTQLPLHLVIVPRHQNNRGGRPREDSSDRIRGWREEQRED
jgi:hypothetical protein